MKVVTVVTLVSTMLLLSGCGQKGALYLPQHSTTPQIEPEVSHDPNDY